MVVLAALVVAAVALGVFVAEWLFVIAVVAGLAWLTVFFARAV